MSCAATPGERGAVVFVAPIAAVVVSVAFEFDPYALLVGAGKFAFDADGRFGFYGENLYRMNPERESIFHDFFFTAVVFVRTVRTVNLPIAFPT